MEDAELNVSAAGIQMPRRAGGAFTLEAITMKAKLAYAIWPWGLSEREQMVTAIKDIKEVGFRYFESVQTAIELFKGDLPAFKDITAKYQVYPVSFYFWLQNDPKQDAHRLSCPARSALHRPPAFRARGRLVGDLLSAVRTLD